MDRKYAPVGHNQAHRPHQPVSDRLASAKAPTAAIGRGTGSAGRSAAMQILQRTIGNQAVQRIVQRDIAGADEPWWGNAPSLSAVPPAQAVAALPYPAGRAPNVGGEVNQTAPYPFPAAGGQKPTSLAGVGPAAVAGASSQLPKATGDEAGILSSSLPSGQDTVMPPWMLKLLGYPQSK